MFIIKTIKKEQAKGELRSLYEKIEKLIGFIPRHFELFGTLDPIGLKMFLEQNFYFYDHKIIDQKILPVLRLYIAKKEKRGYCTAFNSKLLLRGGMDKNIVEDIENTIFHIPFEDKQKRLIEKVLKALYDSKNFDDDDLALLYALGFSDKDFYDVLNYAVTFKIKSKMIEIYLEKTVN